jgi:4-hydroxy-tetrahydrodipicolinate synthase
LFCEPNPIAINTALMMTGAVAPVFRMPYKALTLEQRTEGLALLAKVAEDERVGDKLSLMADDEFQYCC